MRKIVMKQFNPPKVQAARERAGTFLSNEIISSATFPDVQVGKDDLWADRDARSHERYLHGFIFLNDWFGTVLADDQHSSVACDAALNLVKSWISANGNSATAARMAYHDETTAQRVINILQLDAVINKNDPTASASILRPLLDQSAALLATPTFHSTGNNHGMFQDLALLYYAILADWAPLEDRVNHTRLALGRLRDYFGSCFTSEGVHVENTPTYHVMVSRHLAVVQQIAQAAEHEDAKYYTALLAKAEIYATHALMPSGLYPPVSDTTQRRVDSKGVLDVFSSPEFLYAATTGKQGQPPQERILVLPESGYAVYRSAWGNPNATYVFFSAAYNANYHKHSDDLSLYLRSNGTDLLAESGPYSYDYKHPFSRYAYSQFSHNSLVVDDQSLPRTDNRTEAVSLTAKEQTHQRVLVEGTNGRYEDTTHVRQLEIDDSSGSPSINLVDRITSKQHHSYQLLWHLGTDVYPVVHGQGFELFRNNKKLMDLTFSSNVSTQITLHKGRTKPRPLGWKFPSFGEAVPTHVVSIAFSGLEAEVRTRIRLADFSYRDRGISSKNGWKQYYGPVPINYLYVPAPSQNVNKLVIVFSAIHQTGDFTYNYKTTVEQSEVAALYILDDFGDQGAYYYSDHRSTAIYDSVQSLIKRILSDLDLKPADVVATGSSKGGTAALIHGLALGVDQIIAGAPQSRIGSFLESTHPNILRFMSGGTSDDDIAFLDSIVPSTMRRFRGSATKISMVVGSADHHLKRHVLPLLSDAESNGLDASALVLPGVPHSEIGKIFSLYLRANLDQWIRGIDEPALPYEAVTDDVAMSVKVFIHSSTDSIHSYRLYRGSEIVGSEKYSSARNVTFHNLEPGVYRVRVYSRSTVHKTQSSFTTRSIRLNNPV